MKLSLFQSQIILSTLISSISLILHAQTWTVTKTEWTQQDEIEYAEFVHRVGSAKEKDLCATAAECIAVAESRPKVDILVDCADLPYALRSYFAMSKGLPLTFVSGIDAVKPDNVVDLPMRNIRYSTYGNYVTSRSGHIKGSVDFQKIYKSISNSISSAMFRMDPDYDSATNPQDFYSVEIRKATKADFRGIRPGTNIYDPAGHVAVVYKIGQNGRIFYIDAHPDNSLTRGVYGMKFVRSRPQAGAGFKNFRPLKLDSSGSRAILAMNKEIPDFSTVQFYGTNPPKPGESWSKGGFEYNGEKYLYQDYVRIIMADGNVTINPLVEMAEMTDSLCLDVKDRAESVKSAIKNGFNNKDHIARLPYNIFGTSGEWEAESTPSRDARLKVSFLELYQDTQLWIKMSEEHNQRLMYSGLNLKSDLKSTFETAVKKCRLSYVNDSNQKISFSLNDVIDHLWDLSFSPYHCADLRWGGIGGISPTCASDSNKMLWYKALRKLRNQIERRYDDRMDYTADELLNGKGKNLGVETPPEVDVRKLLQ